ncbi:four-helix bundle copper-binding protein, partial [Neisseria sp. P0009.S007]
MNRRQFLGGTAVSLAAAASFALAHGHHDHKGNSHAAPAASSKTYEAARKAAAHCVEAGQICLAHCIRLLSQGDTSMKDCATGVN